MNTALIVLVLAAITLASAAFENKCAKSGYGDVNNPSPAADSQAPAEFYVSFGTNVTSSDGTVLDPIVMKITREWAPLGVDRFFSLIAGE